MAQQAALVHQLRQARARHLTQIHPADRMARQLHQPGPQAVVVLAVEAEKTLSSQFTQQQIGSAFRDPQRVDNGRGATGPQTGNGVENIDGAGQRRYFG